jgi:hypothetical protein
MRNTASKRKPLFEVAWKPKKKPRNVEYRRRNAMIRDMVVLLQCE